MTSTSAFVSSANGFIGQHIVKNYLKITTSYCFLHTSSSFSFTVNDIENDLLRPAVEGTVNALSVVKEFGPQIKKVVVTASAVAIVGFGPHFDGNKVYTENDWNPVTREESLSNPFFGYFGSKKFAELAAKEFVDKENTNFKISFINPPYVFGPQAYAVKDKTNLNLLNEVLNKVIKLRKGVFIEARDIAHAHLVAFENEEATGKFPQSTIPKRDNSRNEEINKSIHKFDDSRTKKILGFEFKSLEESVVDTVDQIYKA